MVIQQANYTDRLQKSDGPFVITSFMTSARAARTRSSPFSCRKEMSACSRTLIVLVFSLTLVDVLALCPSTEVQPGFLFSCELRRDDIFSAVDVAKGKSLVIRGGAR